jgi:hypothetical protein
VLAGLGEGVERAHGLIERPEQRARVQSRRFEAGAQVRRDRQSRPTWYADADAPFKQA